MQCNSRQVAGFSLWRPGLSHWSVHAKYVVDTGTGTLYKSRPPVYALILQAVFFLHDFRSKPWNMSVPSHACLMLCLSNASWFYHANDIWQEIKIKAPQHTVFSSNLLPHLHRSKRLPQHPVADHPLTFRLTYLLIYLLTYLLTPWCRVLLEKLTGL